VQRRECNFRLMSFAAACALALIIGIVPSAYCDTADCSWVFSTPGNMLGWQANKYSGAGVSDGYFHGTTTAYDSSLKGPFLGSTCPARTNHYVQIKMRMYYPDSPTNRFGASDAYVYFTTSVEPSYSSSKSVAFKTYGNGVWKVYNVRMGHLATWTGNIQQLKIYCTSVTGARTDIEWIKIMRDTTPPEFEAENMWTYEDGETTNDATPTIKVRNAWDQVSGIDRAEFYLRPGTSSSEDDWTLQGTDADPSDGWQFTFPSLADGVYDLGVKMYDKSGNAACWLDGDNKWIDDLCINSTTQTRIDVHASLVTKPVQKKDIGNNSNWFEWNNKYNPATARLPDSLETLIGRMGIPVFRYPGGCYSDTFYWKKSIGPLESREDQYSNGCNTQLVNRGPAKFGLDEFLRFCETRGMEPMLTVRFRWPGAPGAPGLDGPDPYAEALADAVDLVEYCNSPNDGSNPNGGTDWAAVRAANGHPDPYNVKLFEIGNEPWGPDPYGSPGNIGLDGASTYSVAFLTFLEQMKAVDPSIEVSVTSYAQADSQYDLSNPSWMFSVYEQTGSFINHSQIHPYVPYSCWQTDLVKLYQETMAAPRALDDLLCVQRQAIRQTSPDRYGEIRLRLTEWNINYGWVYDPSQGRINLPHAKTLKAAIAAADAIRVFLENQDIVESAEWWNLYDWVYAPIAADDVTANPVYHTLRIYNKHFGDDLVQCKVTGSPTFDYVQTPGSILKSQYDLAYITAIASISDDRESLYLTVINKDRDNSHAATISLSEFLPPGASQVDAEIWELNGPNVDDYQHPNDVGITETVATYPASFTYVFTAHSVTSFKFTQSPMSVDHLGFLRSLEPGTRVHVMNKVVTGLIDSNAFYIQEEDQYAGIRVVAQNTNVRTGNRATIVGRVRINEHLERYIDAEAIEHDDSSVTIEPIAIVQKSFVEPTVSTTGLLVCVFGWTTGTSENYFYVHDGSQIQSGSGNAGVKVYCGSPPGDGKLVVVTGIRSQEIQNGESSPEPVIYTRTAGDVNVIL